MEPCKPFDPDTLDAIMHSITRAHALSTVLNDDNMQCGEERDEETKMLLAGMLHEQLVIARAANEKLYDLRTGVLSNGDPIA